jgi:hypothetical protein
MPKVISGVQGAKAFATDGIVQNIPGVTNRQGAKLTLEKRVAAVIEAKGGEKPPPAAEKAVESAKAAEPVSQKPPEENKPAQESAEDPNEGVDPSDMDLNERSRKAIAKKHREMKAAEAQATRLKADLLDTENFSKSQYQRAIQAEERAQELQRELEQLKSGTAPVKEAPKGAVKPDPHQFYDAEGKFKLAEYTEAVGKWSADTAIAEDRARTKKEQEEQAKTAAAVAKERAVAVAKERTQEAKNRYPDWDKVAEAAKPIRLPDIVGAYISASPHIGDIGYYLMKHPEYVESLNKLNPLDAIGELGELCIRWKKTKETPREAEKPRIEPPAPVSPLPGSGSAGVQTDPSKMTPAQLRAYDRERAVSKRRA